MRDEEPKPKLKSSDLFIGLVGLVLMVPAFALPMQIVVELAHWMQTATWLNYDWYMLTGTTVEEVDLGLDLLGATYVVRWLMDTWVSLPFAAISGAIFLALAD